MYVNSCNNYVFIFVFVLSVGIHIMTCSISLACAMKNLWNLFYSIEEDNFTQILVIYLFVVYLMMLL
jgi:hypothetical protein